MLNVPALLLVLAIIGCAPVPSPAPAPAPAQPAVATSPLYPRDLLWARTSAEHRALFVQVYRSASERLAEQTRGRERGTWAVIADADETLLDNSEYQRRLHEHGARFDNATWNAWVRERAAPALPGAVDYVNVVRALGGHVVVVTNRDEEVCDPTRENLRAVGLLVAAVLCRTDASDKNPRFAMVRGGLPGGALPALDVLQWVGDNIQDFPALTQRVREAPPGALALFGDRYWVLPNPMYGSFERNSPR